MNQYIQWKQAYEFGFEPIDAQHKMVIGLLNDLYEMLAGGFSAAAQADEILDRLVFYTESHFEYEEKVLRFIGFNNLARHAQTHREMEARTKGIALTLQEDPEEQLRIALKLLRDWWTHHIQETDRMYAPYLEKFKI